jgi:integrase
MARLFKRKGSEWWLDYVDGAGMRHRVKTTTASKREAEDLLAEVLSDLKRQQLGLELAPYAAVKTLGEAWSMWLEKWCPEPSLERERGRFSRVKDSWIAGMKLAGLAGEHLERWFAESVEAGLSPRTVNGDRRIIRNIYNTLMKKKLYRGYNPVKETRPLDEPEFAHQLLTEAELKRLLSHLPDDWRPLFIVAFATGLRRGEIYALRKDRAVVDLERRILTPRGSNHRPMTKGKKVKSIPLTPDAFDVIAAAWKRAEHGALLFPNAEGGLRKMSMRPSEVLRTAMVAAGLVEHWEHSCRWGCRNEPEVHPDEQQRKCPSCSRIMWPKPVVRRVRFHDLRHSAADHLFDHGVALENVSRMLRHSSTQITEKVYMHRTVEALRKAITSPSAGALEQHLEVLQREQSADVAQVLAEAREKLALIRHRSSNLVPFTPTEKASR